MDILTAEGQKMYDSLTQSLTKGTVVVQKRPKLTKITFEVSQVRLDFIGGEINKMIINSELVIRDCETLMKNFKTAEEYMKSELKAVRTIHENFVIRLNRIIKNLPAFESEEHLKEYL